MGVVNHLGVVAEHISERARRFFTDEHARRPQEFATVLAQERQLIRIRREARGFTEVGRSRQHEGVTGLALSGGGIRSATYLLGVLQALHHHGLLKGIDYLSTVSGGGFTGGWLTAWLCRRRTPFPTAEGLAPDRDDAAQKYGVDREVVADRQAAGVDAIRHLRLYANYLTPRKGFLSLDTWRAAATIGRDLILTNAVLLPVLLAVILLTDVYFIIFDPTWVRSDEQVLRNFARARLVLIPIGAVAAWFLVLSGTWLRYQRNGRSLNTMAIAGSLLSLILLVFLGGRMAQVIANGRTFWEASLVELGSLRNWLADDWQGRLTVGWVVVLIAFWSIATRVQRGDQYDNSRVRARLERCLTGLLISGSAAAVVLGLGAYGHELGLFLRTNGRDKTLALVADNLRWLTLATATLGSIYTVFNMSPSATADARATGKPTKLTVAVLTVTPVTVLIVLALASSFLAHRAIGELMDPSWREGRVAVLRACTGVLIVLCAYAAGRESTFDAMRAKKGVQVATWAGTVLLGVLLATAISGWYGGLSFVILSASLSLMAVSWLRRRLEALGNTRPAWLLSFGFAVLAAMESVQIEGVSKTAVIAVAVPLIGAVLAWVFAIGWFADPNALSLHAFYRARLVRGFLGASNEERGKHLKDIRDFDEKDDLLLSLAADPKLPGPYHLINATLNLTAGRDLAASQRSSDRFLLSPLFCGSSRTAYRPTEEYMNNGLQLGTAMAVSGAAISPVMGSVSPTASLSMLLTILNVRLGFWAPTPNKPRWREESASLWPLHLMFEMTSQTNELASYCYLTDGGHFDNTGLYSLIERGCRHIIVVDCGADSKACFEDLGTAIRRCRIDFGTRIDLDLTPAIAKEANDRRSVLVGTIRYDTRHAERLRLTDDRGTLIVLKPSVGGEDSADVRQYQRQNDAFPQHVTTDQWFDEAQFESYRRLGELTTERVLARDDARLQKALKDFDAEPTPERLMTVFDQLARSLSPTPRVVKPRAGANGSGKRPRRRKPNGAEGEAAAGASATR